MTVALAHSLNLWVLHDHSVDETVEWFEFRLSLVKPVLVKSGVLKFEAGRGLNHEFQIWFCFLSFQYLLVTLIHAEGLNFDILEFSLIQESTNESEVETPNKDSKKDQE